MKISQLITLLEKLAPLSLQEDYDNAGLIVGDRNSKVSGVLCTLDCTEAVINEAIAKNCNVVVAHHPIIFKGLKTITGKSYVERTVLSAIKNDIAIYAIHTNLDNVKEGVNAEIGKRLNLHDLEILLPKRGNICKLQTFVPKEYLNVVLDALFDAGAGAIGDYNECSFTTSGTGTFKAGPEANPHVGVVGERHHENEMKIEVVLESHLVSNAVNALIDAHPYEEVAYDVIHNQIIDGQTGSGMVGKLNAPMSESEFLQHLGKVFDIKVIRHTELLQRPINTVAICGGSGSFLLGAAKQKRADALVTSDFKYHEFFDADKDIVIYDIGHFESEQFTPHLLQQYLEDKNVTFAVLLSEVKTNPIHYYIQ